MTILISRYPIRSMNNISMEGLLFVAVTDGESTRLLFPNSVDEREVKVSRQAIGARIATADSNKPEDILIRLAYRMGVDFIIDEEEFKDMDDALEKAKEYILEENAFEESRYDVLDPITPREIGESDE